MIHHTPEGHYIKLGLNFSRTPGGFRMLWAWYDFATNTATTYRLRIRLHMAPRIMCEKNTFNVIDNYLTLNDLELVQKEVLEDLKAMEDTQKRTNEPLAYIKP
jgi:hypothetical protein